MLQAPLNVKSIKCDGCDKQVSPFHPHECPGRFGSASDRNVRPMPCPFCGHKDPFIEEHPAHTHVIATFMPDHPGSWTIECGGPGCSAAMIATTKDELLTKWNRRAVPNREADG